MTAVAASATRVMRAEQWVVAQRGASRALLAFAAGALSVLAFAPFHAFPVLFATLPVLVWLIDASPTVRSAAVAGWWYGFGFFLFNLFWIGEAFLVEAEKFALLMPFAVTLLPSGMALFWAMAAGAAKRFWTPGASRVLALAIALALVEWLRGHILTGLPWNVLGYALTYPLPLMQSAALTGVYGLTLPAVLIFATPAVLLAGRDGRPSHADRSRAVLIAVVPLAVAWGYGSWRLAENPARDVPGVKLRIVQPSVPQREKWQPQHQLRIFEDHIALSLASPDGVRDDLAPITHVIWPEAAMPFLPLEQPKALERIAQMLPEGRVLLSGALRREQDGNGVMRGYNSLIAFDDTAKAVAIYDKVHLVPFGEYLPLAPVLTALGFQKLTHGLGSFDTGPGSRPPLTVPGLPPVAGLICYEVLFPGAVIDDGQRPGAIINVTNDGWFGNTTGPRQHLHQARVRAVEEGVPLVRVANNGISAVVDPFGRILARLDLDRRGVVDSPLPHSMSAPLYARFGDIIFGMLWLMGIIYLCGTWQRSVKAE